MRFVNNDMEEGKTRFSVGVDTANFASMDRYEEFYESIAGIDEFFERSDLGQLALDPEPIIKFVIENPVLSLGIVWLLKRMARAATHVVDEAMKKTVDKGLAALAKKARVVVAEYRRLGKAQDAPVCAQVIFSGEPKLVLVVKGAHGDSFPELDLAAMRPVAELCEDLVEEGDLQELRMEWRNGRWELLYAKTLSGRVVGTLECYAETMEKLAGRPSRSSAGVRLPGGSRSVEGKGGGSCDSQA